jgi:hypothetical protein
MTEVKTAAPTTRSGLVYSNPVQYLTQHGWTCLGNPDYPEAAGWLDPAKPELDTEEVVQIYADLEFEDGQDAKGQTKVRVERDPLTVVDYGKLGTMPDNRPRIPATRVRYTPRAEPVSFQFALWVQRERDLDARARSFQPAQLSVAT